jgi:hypothetical protein
MPPEHADIATSRPVLIIGNPRSGSSLLYKTLQKHPAFAPRQINLQETHVLTHVSYSFAFEWQEPRKLVNYMLQDRARWKRFLRQTATLRRLGAVLAPAAVPLRGAIPTPVWERFGTHLIVRNYFANAWSARGCERLVEKTPRNFEHIDKLRLVFPDARMLAIIRHPVDALSSYYHRAQKDAAAKWADVPLEKFERIYRDSIDKVTREADSGRGLLVVRYEDFTSDPEAEFRRLCEFVGEPFEESALEEANPDTGRTGSDRHLHTAIKTKTKRWEEFLAPEVATRLEDDLADVMARVGYSRYT